MIFILLVKVQKRNSNLEFRVRVGEFSSAAVRTVALRQEGLKLNLTSSLSELAVVVGVRLCACLVFGGSFYGV